MNDIIANHSIQTIRAEHLASHITGERAHSLQEWKVLTSFYQRYTFSSS